MKIQIREHNVKLTKALRLDVERRLVLTLGRFGERIGKVVVRFSGTPGESVGKRCQIEVSIRPLRTVRAEDRDVDPLVAAARASDRLSRSVARALERESHWDLDPIRPRIVRGSRS